MDFQKYLSKFETLPGLLSVSFHIPKSNEIHSLHKHENINDQLVQKIVTYLEKQVLDLSTKSVKLDTLRFSVIAYVEESVSIVLFLEPDTDLSKYNAPKNEFLNQALISL